MRYTRHIITASFFVLLASASLAQVQSTPFIYQGEIKRNGIALDGQYQMEFDFYQTISGGSPLESVSGNVQVNDGLFQTEFHLPPDIFGAVAVWLEITVIDDNGSSHTLSPRQVVGAAPVAMHALSGTEGPQGPEGPEGPAGPAGDGLWEEFSAAGGGIRYDDGRVAIGRSSASAKLDIDARGSNRPLMVRYNDDIVLSTYTNNSLSIGTTAPGPDNGLAVSGRTVIGDHLGVATSSPVRRLHVKGSGSSNIQAILEAPDSSNRWGLGTRVSDDDLGFYFQASNSNTLSFRGRIDSTSGEYSSSSDRRLKRNIEPYQGVLEGVMGLEVKSYAFEDGNEQRSIGLIAQDVDEHFPELVRKSEDGFLSLVYSHLGVIALQAIREQQAVIDDQDAEIQALRSELEAVRSETAERLARMESVLLGETEVAEVRQ